MLTIHVLEVQPIDQKFLKPNSDDFILFLDDSVSCPSANNPLSTDKGHVSVSAVCFDCPSFKGFFTDCNQKSIFCEGSFDPVNIHTPVLRNYLEQVEQPVDSFWSK